MYHFFPPNHRRDAVMPCWWRPNAGFALRSALLRSCGRLLVLGRARPSARPAPNSPAACGASRVCRMSLNVGSIVLADIGKEKNNVGMDEKL